MRGGVTPSPPFHCLYFAVLKVDYLEKLFFAYAFYQAKILFYLMLKAVQKRLHIFM